MAKRRQAIYNLALLILALGVTVGCDGKAKEPPKGAPVDVQVAPDVTLGEPSTTEAGPAKETPAGAPESTPKP